MATKQQKESKDYRSQIRLPADLATYLKHRAIDNSRTFNSEVAYRLKQSKAQEEAHAKTPA